MFPTWSIFTHGLKWLQAQCWFFKLYQHLSLSMSKFVLLYLGCSVPYSNSMYLYPLPCTQTKRLFNAFFCGNCTFRFDASPCQASWRVSRRWKTWIVSRITPRKFNIAPEKWWERKTTFLLGPGNFSGKAWMIFCEVHVPCINMSSDQNPDWLGYIGIIISLYKDPF